MSKMEAVLKPADDRIVELDPSLIDPCPWQQRAFSKEDDSGLKELGANIKVVGQQQAIHVRVHPDKRKKGRYQLLHGERRVRACAFAGIPVRAVIRLADDTGAMISCFVENYMRQDLTPLEEAAGFRTLLEGENGKAITKKELATRLGINSMLVTRRTQLNNLTAQWKKRFRDPKQGFVKWPASLMEYLSKFPAQMQEEMASCLKPWDIERMTLEELRDDFAQWTHELTSARFKLDDETLCPKAGACVNCPKRSSHEPELFDPEDFGLPGNGKVPIGDRCLDGECYEAKMAAYVKRREAEVRAEHPDIVLVGNEPSDDKGRVIRKDWDLQDCKKNAKGAMHVLHVDGRSAGHVGWMKSLHANDSTSTASTSEPGTPKPLAERRKKYDKRRQVHVLDQIIAAIEESEKDIKRFEHLEWPDLLAFGLVMGTLDNAADECMDRGTVWMEYEAARIGARKDERAVVARLFFFSLGVLGARLRGVQGAPDIAKRTELEYGCRILGLKLADLEKAAVDAIPYPKSWAGLKPDGTPKTAKSNGKTKANGKKVASKKTSRRGMIKTAA
jgi:ParB/RepB/Spo0J family partition protein